MTHIITLNYTYPVVNFKVCCYQLRFQTCSKNVIILQLQDNLIHNLGIIINTTYKTDRRAGFTYS